MRGRFFSTQTRRDLWTRASQIDGIARCETLYGWGCGAILYPEKHVYDHVVRYELTRDSTFENGQLLCDACNKRKTFTCDIPEAAKGKRVHDRHIGAQERPRRPMPCGRHSKRKMKIGGGTVERLTLSQRLVRAGIITLEDGEPE